MIILALWLGLAASPAHAQESEAPDAPDAPEEPSFRRDEVVGLSVGLEMAVNDPYLLRTGLRIGLEYMPIRWVGFEVDMGLYPDLGEGDWTPLLHSVADAGALAPDLTRVLWQTRIALRAEPLQAGLGKGVASAGAFVGGGVVYTVDDYSLLDEGDYDPDSPHHRELHPQLCFGITTGVRWRVAGFRVRLGWTYYRETVHAGLPRARMPLWIAGEATFWLR